MISSQMMGKHRTALANVIEESSDPKMILYYVEKDLKAVLKSITSFTQYDLVNEKLRTLSEDSQLKTALMLGLKFKAKLESDNGSRLAFFMRIIIPTLEWPPVCKYLTEAEGTLLSNIVVDAPLYKLSE